MNALTVQNPRQKCDLENKNDNYRQYLTVIMIITIIILRLYCTCVCVTIFTPSPTSIRLKVQFCGFNHVDEMGGARNCRKLRARSKM